jgi:hypothetical protein
MQPGRPHRPFRRPGGIQSAATPAIPRVRAASVSPVDYKIRSGKYPAVTKVHHLEPASRSASRNAAISSIMVGFAPPPVGKTDVARTLRLGTAKVRRFSSTTASDELLPILVDPPG